MATSAAPQLKPLTGRLAAVLVLLGLSVFINYIDRGNLSIAAPMLKNELGISANQLGILLSAFFWTYACLQPVIGWLVDQVDVNWVMAGGFIVWSAATAVTGVLHTFSALLVARLMVGIGESVAYPSYSKIIALNFQENHRGVANSAITVGHSFGPGLGMLMGGMLMARYGWRSFFIALGSISLLWIVPWLKWKPEGCATGRSEASGIPDFREFVTMRSAWGTCAGLFASNYVNYFLITWLPFYLVRERHFSMDNMAEIGGISFLVAGLCAAIGGWASDHWIRAGATPTLVRKSFTAGGIALSGSLLALSAVSPPVLAVALVVGGIIAFETALPHIWSITQTLAGPQAAGRWTGFQNFIGNLAGVAAPAITGFMLERTGHFYWPFAILAAVAFAGAASWFVLVGKIEPVTWHKQAQATVSSGI